LSNKRAFGARVRGLPPPYTSEEDADLGGGPVPRWMVLLVLGLTAVAATSSSYTAYKVYQITDGKLTPAKGKR
jgi:hypothetical protein